ARSGATCLEPTSPSHVPHVYDGGLLRHRCDARRARHGRVGPESVARSHGGRGDPVRAYPAGRRLHAAGRRRRAFRVRRRAAAAQRPRLAPHASVAPTVGVLVDSPLLVGRLRSLRFAVDGVPHRVVYSPVPDAAPFDTVALVGNIERLSRQAVALFGRAPYRDYSFLLEDGAYGALEHRSSVTLGAPSADLARDPTGLLMEIAHEYFHTWNLMRIHP